MRAGDQPPWYSGGGGGGGDDRWSHFDDTTSHLHFQFGERESDRPTVQLRAHRHERFEDIPWWRRRTTLIVASSFLAVLVIGTVAFVALRPDSDAQAMDPGPTGTASATATGSATPSPTSTPTPTPTQEEQTTEAPPPEVIVPAEPADTPPDPVVTQAPPPGCAPTFEGDNASASDVRQALAAAGAKEYWRGVALPSNYQGPLVSITVPTKVMNAIAWQESGWQSAIHACDGGLGTMQLMTGTLDQINQRFDKNYSVPLDLQENTEAGANYLQWLIMYFGVKYFGQNFDMYAKGPTDEAAGIPLELRDVVIAAYNVGPGEVENYHDPNNDQDDTLSVPNWDYVNAVESFMDSCPCDAL